MDLPQFYIYDASAGSGKTYTITREYLCILLKQNNVFAFQNILAITFTNKAAAEMKSRIIKSLVCFSGFETEESYESLMNDVSKKTGLSDEEIQTKSLQILKYLIPNYAGFEVSTIDSFNHRIIRTFAKDLSLSQNFDIDLDTKPYVKQAVENLIENVGIDNELTEWLVDFVHYKINRDKSGNIRLDLNEYAELVLNENNYDALEQLQKHNLKELRNIKSKITKHRNQLLIQLHTIAENFLGLLDSQDIEEKVFPYQSIPKYFKKILDDQIESKFESKWHNIEETSFYNKKVNDSQKHRIDNLRPEIETLFLDSKDLSLKYHLAERVLKSFVPLSMISEIQNQINIIKEEEGVLFVNDFNRIISKHIKHQPVPFIYERLGEKFRHYFIDEFQDTSKLQWQNLSPLVENALSSQQNDGSFGSLYLVGDVKQSIYEWRGGDPKQFLDLSQGNTHPFTVKAEKKVLEDNWRSAKTIVDFNNGFFEHASGYLTETSHQNLYKNARQNHKKDLEGYVDIRFLPQQEDKTLMLEQRIQELQNIVLSVKDQGFALNDICILVRQNSYGTEIAEAFNTLENPIPIVSQESLLIASDEKVNLLTQFFYLIHHFDQEMKIDFMMSWLNHINYADNLYHEALSQIKELNADKFFEALKTFHIDFQPKIYENLSMYDKAEYVVRALQIEHDANAYIQFYLDEIFDFSASHSKNMIDFLEYWEDQKTKKSISTSETSEAVNIMTIHKSKGLQFPVVIYAHANFTLADLSKTQDWVKLDEETYGVPFIYERISKSVQGLSPSFEEVYHENMSKQELANLNTAYVCMTRAVEQLYILSEPVRGSSTSFKDLLCSFLKQKQVFQEDQNHYIFGSKTSKKQTITEDETINLSKFESYSVLDFYQELSADQVLEFQSSEAVVYGQNIHDILQKLIYATDIEQLNITQDLKTLLKNVVSHSEISQYFNKSWEIYNETELVYESQIYRPDRLCIQNKEAVIIDYKTGNEKASHFSQLTNYKNAIEALGFIVKKAILVYLSDNIYIKTI